MTDKVQKIREEVKNKLEVMQYQVHRKDAYKELKYVLDYIDSLQEESDYCCGECAKWIDGKGCSREKQNTHCITDAACEEGVKRSSKQKKPKFKVHDYIKPIDSCLGSPRTICEVCDGWYVTNQGTLSFEFENNWEAVEEPAWIKELRTKLDSMSKEELEQMWKKYETDEEEEPASEELEEAAKYYIPDESYHMSIESEEEGSGENVYDYVQMIGMFKAGAKWQKEKDESVSKDLEEASKNYALNNTPWDDCKDEIQEAFKAGAEWRKLKDMGITNNAKDVVTNILNSSDNPLDTYAAEVAFIMIPANLTENYHITNRDRISDAVRLGANWQKQQDQSTIELAEDHAMLAGMEKMKEQMMAKAVDGTTRPDDNEIWCNLTSSNLKDGDKVKIIIIKED